MKKYEIMFIVKSTLSEEEVDNAVKNLESILIDNGAEITNFKKYGKRELAYEINKNKSGYYFLFNLEAKDSKAIDEFNRKTLINKDVIRHLVTNVE